MQSIYFKFEGLDILSFFFIYCDIQFIFLQGDWEMWFLVGYLIILDFGQIISNVQYIE